MYITVTIFANLTYLLLLKCFLLSFEYKCWNQLKQCVKKTAARLKTNLKENKKKEPKQKLTKKINSCDQHSPFSLFFFFFFFFYRKSQAQVKEERGTKFAVSEAPCWHTPFGPQVQVSTNILPGTVMQLHHLKQRSCNTAVMNFNGCFFTLNQATLI